MKKTGIRHAIAYALLGLVVLYLSYSVGWHLAFRDRELPSNPTFYDVSRDPYFGEILSAMFSFSTPLPLFSLLGIGVFLFGVLYLLFASGLQVQFRMREGSNRDCGNCGARHNKNLPCHKCAPVKKYVSEGTE